MPYVGVISFVFRVHQLLLFGFTPRKRVLPLQLYNEESTEFRIENWTSPCLVVQKITK